MPGTTGDCDDEKASSVIERAGERYSSIGCDGSIPVPMTVSCRFYGCIQLSVD